MPTVGFDEYGYALGRLATRLYISKAIRFSEHGSIFRYGWKRLEEGPLKEVVKIGDEFVLRETATGIHQFKAKFIEDSRHITHLHIQKWNTRTGKPIGEQVVLYGDQIDNLINFIKNIRRVEIPGDEGVTEDEANLRLVRLPDAKVQTILEERPELIAQFVRNQITTEDVVALAYRRKQLSRFSDMIEEADPPSEPTWQQFFEENQWIFGYGLSYVFTTGLEGRKLQQAIRGANIVSPGKVPDGIMKTRAAVSALCLVEIKTSGTSLLKDNPYRSGTWAPSAELSGAVAQCQETLRAASDELGRHHRLTDEHGNPTGEELTSVQPRSFLVIGDLREFQSKHGLNLPRYQAFEGFRRNLRQPEIITFDELYERARFIVKHAEGVTPSLIESGDEIPF